MRRGTATLWLGLTLPTAALAHAGGRMVILTLPTGWSIAGASAAVALTGLIAARPRRPPAPPRPLLEHPALLPEGAASWLAAVLFLALLATGFLGPRDPLANPLVLGFWIGIRIALVLACLAFGDLWRAASPWAAPVAWTRRRLGRQGGIGLSRLGYWPAVAGALGLAWLEIVSLAPTDPAILARTLGLYWLLVFGLGVLEGEAWLDRGEVLTVHFALLGRIAPLWRERRGASVRWWLAAPGTRLLGAPPLPPSGAAFIVACLAAVSFDGLSETFRWLALNGVNPLEFPGRSAMVRTNSLGLLATFSATAALLLAATALGRRLAGSRGGFWRDVGLRALSFLPIAAGYHAAHYLVALLTDGQYALAALSGTPGHGETFGFLQDRTDVTAIWTAQVALILGGHVLAVLLGTRLVTPNTLRAHLPMTALMVALTAFGLWLLATPTAG